MREQTYLVLLALADGPRHGYGVVQAVRELTDGRVTLAAGTLYGILDRAVTADQARVTGEEVVDGRLRRYYELTGAGRAAVATYTAELAALAARARSLLAVAPRHGAPVPGVA